MVKSNIEKRFTKGEWTNCRYDICEILKDEEYYCTVATDDVDLIINVLEENEQLKSEIHLLYIEMVKTKSYEQLEKELNRFKKKNEQLKDEISKLIKCIQDSAKMSADAICEPLENGVWGKID